MIPFKGRIVFRQYIPRKPHSTGIKYWALVDEHRYMYYFQIYVGKKERKGEKTQDQTLLSVKVIEAMDAAVSGVIYLTLSFLMVLIFFMLTITLVVLFKSWRCSKTLVDFLLFYADQTD